MTFRLFATIAILASVLSTSRCHAVPTASIWVINSQGILVDVTSTTTYINGGIYGTDGQLLGVAPGQEGHIYSLTGDLIGMILVSNN